MSQYTIPRTQRFLITELINPSGKFTLTSMDEVPIGSPDARFWRYSCESGASRAMICVTEHCERPDDIVITVSIDLRRLPLLWRIIGDWRLSRVLSENVERAGAIPLGDCDG